MKLKFYNYFLNLIDICFYLGMNSASRYYLNQFRDAYRQATIDILTGQIVSESLMSDDQLEANSSFYQDLPEQEDNETTAEHVKSIIEDCQKLLIPDLNRIVGSWGLIGKFANLYLLLSLYFYNNFHIVKRTEF